MCWVHRSALSAQATTCHVGTKRRGTPGFASFEATVLVPALRVDFGSWGLYGEQTESKRPASQALKLWRDQGNPHQVTRALLLLSDSNRLLDLLEEGIQQAKEALEISQQVKDTVPQTISLSALARLFLQDNQVVAAEETASQVIAILSEQPTNRCRWMSLHSWRSTPCQGQLRGSRQTLQDSFRNRVLSQLAHQGVLDEPSSGRAIYRRREVRRCKCSLRVG